MHHPPSGINSSRRKKKYEQAHIVHPYISNLKYRRVCCEGSYTRIEGRSLMKGFAKNMFSLLVVVNLSANAFPQLGLDPSPFGGSDWNIVVVDSNGDVGKFASIALDKHGYPCIAYLDDTKDVLKYANWTGTNWTKTTVDATGSIGGTISLSLDKNDNPHISYFDGNHDDLKYAKWAGTGWINDTVDSVGSVGWFTSMALDTEDRPHISYFDNANHNLKYAKWTGTKWVNYTVDSSGKVGYYSSIGVDRNNHAHISYFNATGESLKYAQWIGTKWSIQTVDSSGDVGKYTSIALDELDIPHISYFNESSFSLKYANFTGNIWNFETIDSASEVGWHTSIALDQNGHPHVMYLDRFNRELKYANWTGAKWNIEKVDSVSYIYWGTSLALDDESIPHVAYAGFQGNHDLKYATKTNLTANKPPVAVAAVETEGPEGSSTEFNGTGSFDSDGTILSYSWDFDSLVDSDSDGNYTNDNEATGPTSSHVYYDNGDYVVTLKIIDDSGQVDTDTCVAAVLNVAPMAEADGPYQGDEPHTVQFTGTFTDPGILDTHTFQWDFDFDGITFNVDSTEQSPAHQWLDDFDGNVAFKVIDDDGGWDLDVTHVTVHNVPPDATANGPYDGFEGTPIQFKGDYTDPGPLDTHTYEWDFNYDGTTFAPDATGNPYQKTWYDDYSGNIALRVTDDDGGWDLDVTTVTVVNVPPVAKAGEDKEGFEVSTFAFNGSFYDAGVNDTHEYEWDFDYDGTTFDVEATGQSVAHTFIDDFDGEIALRVTDDDGGVDIDTAHVLVRNVSPTVTLELFPIEVDAFLRIAGEKWHDVSIELFEDGVLIANGTLFRYPGSPNDQMLDLSSHQFDYSKNYTATVTYTPDDDPINGKTNGANPCWIILRFDDGQELWIHHTFNVQHPDAYVWEVDLTAAILSHGMTFEATAFDPGADELTFHWDFGDGTNVTSFYSNANGTYPVGITEIITHVFPGSGNYTVTLTVEDGDGGSGLCAISLIIQ
jgi:hypothetical protein